MKFRIQTKYLQVKQRLEKANTGFDGIQTHKYNDNSDLYRVIHNLGVTP